MRWATAVGLALVGAGVVMVVGAASAEEVARAPAATRAAVVDAGAWKGVMEKLESAEFAVRESGQRELGKATWQDREVLKTLGEGAADPEVKARVAAEVAALDEAAAMNPPGITLDLKDATRGEAVAAWGKALGVKMEFAGGTGEGVNVHAVERPFGEVFLEMSKSAVMMFDLAGRMDFMVPGVTTGMSRGSLAIAPWRVQKVPEPGAPLAQSTVLSYVVGVDPRVRLTQAPVLETKSILDEAGGERVPAGSAWSVMRTGSSGWVYTPVQRLAVGKGEKIVAVRGVAHFSVVLQEERVEVADMEKDFGKPVKLGEQVITFNSFTVGKMQTRIDFLSKSAGGVPVGAPGNQVNMTLTDGAGRLMCETPIGDDRLVVGLGGQFQGPIKALFSRATKVKVVDVPFEWKGLSIALGGN